MPPHLNSTIGGVIMPPHFFGKQFGMMRMNTPIRCLFVGLAALFLASCETPATAPAFPDLTWNHLTPLKFAAAEVEVVDDYAAPFKSPNVEHEFPLVPELAIRRWITDRVQAVGTEGNVRIIVREASVVGEALKVKEGVKGLFYKEQAAKYTGVLEVAIELRSARGFVKSKADARVSRSRTVPEEVPPNELDQIFFEFTSALMTDLDRTLDANVKKFMAGDLM